MSGSARVLTGSVDVLGKQDGTARVYTAGVEVLMTTTFFDGKTRTYAAHVEVMRAVGVPVEVDGETLTIDVSLTGGEVSTGTTIDGETFIIDLSLLGGEASTATVVAGETFIIDVSLLGGVASYGDTEIAGETLHISLSLAGGDVETPLIEVASEVLNVVISLHVTGLSASSTINLVRDAIFVDSDLLLSETVEDIPVQGFVYQEWTVLKGTARRVVHDVFAITAIHKPSTPGGEAKAIRVRWHPRGTRLMGDLQGQGYGELISSVDRMVFNVEQLALAEVVLTRGDRIALPDYNNQEFMLDALDPADGPVTQTWEVVRV